MSSTQYIVWHGILLILAIIAFIGLHWISPYNLSLWQDWIAVGIGMVTVFYISNKLIVAVKANHV